MLRAIMCFAIPHSRGRYYSCGGKVEPIKFTRAGVLWTLVALGVFTGFVVLVVNQHAMPENVFVTLDVLGLVASVAVFVGLCVSNERRKKARRQTPSSPR